MYIKVYFNDKPLFLCDELTDEINAYAHHDDAVFMDEFSNPSINSIIHEMRTEKIHAGIFYHDNLDKLKKAFWKKFVIIQAGGGLVLNEQDEILFIFRRKKWDLPKGKLDKGETIEQCALREVEEETGLKNVKLKRPLLVSYHTYDENGKHFLKETHWYVMAASAKQLLQPQLEEQITEIRWVAKHDMREILKNTFPSIAEVLQNYEL
jgi:8-oxo-dGTP pyrophosphatase MutT (NUDIX family)